VENRGQRDGFFSTLTGRGVRVAVVDSGIAPDHPGVGRIAGGVDLAVGPEGRAVCGPDFTDRAGHGTACAGIIRKKAPDAELYSIRIFDTSLTADGRALVAAIRWAAEQGMDVVNLSLGTTEVAFRDAIAGACREAVQAGVILVAAAHNEGRESYPAALPDAIGVAGGRVYGRYGYSYRPGETVECVAHGDEQRLCWLNGGEIVLGGTSFAAPHIAGIVALIREARPRATLAEVREVLKAHALGGAAEPIRGGGDRPFTFSSTPPTPHSEVGKGSKYGWIRRAALYPYNKEMHAFVRFRDLLRFEVVGVADPAGRRLVGRDAGEVIGEAPAGLRIAPRLQDALRDADTLILGYVDRLGDIAGRDLLRESIQKALERGVHVFSFLPVPSGVYGDLYAIARQKGLRIVYPFISSGEVRSVIRKTRPDGAVDVPVIGVFGTSSQQGKFTIQLILRRRLIQAGYRVGQVGTEHHAELFGMDLAFPMGYASPLEFPLQHYAPYLDHKMQEICQKRRPEIVLVGSQSGTIPYDVREQSTHSLPSLAFLLGTRPDACILVVNSIDPDGYIRDTLDTIRALGGAPTILLAMGDKEKHIRSAYGRSLVTPRQMSRGEIERRLQGLEETFRLPAVEILSERGQQRMVETIIRHFAAGDPARSGEGLCQMRLA